MMEVNYRKGCFAHLPPVFSVWRCQQEVISPAMHKEWFLYKIITNAEESIFMLQNMLQKLHMGALFLWMLYPLKRHWGVWLITCYSVSQSYFVICSEARRNVLLMKDLTMLLSTWMVVVHQKLLLMRQAPSDRCCVAKLQKLCQQGGRWK